MPIPRLLFVVPLTAALALVFTPLRSVAQQKQQKQLKENPYTEVESESGNVKDTSKNSKPTPRTSDGHPNLSGFWKGPLIFGGMFKETGGKPPFTPAGAAAYQYNLTKTTNPEGLCIFAGIPRASISGVPFEIVQSKDRIAFLYELMWTFRSIPLDGRPHPTDIDPTFWGNGVGRWEGDTLVIDSVGFKTNLSWLDDDAHPHSDQMHVIERWTRTDADHLAHSVTVDDPKYYSKPFTFSRVFLAMEPGQELYEFACDENNVDRDGGHLGKGPLDLRAYPLSPTQGKPLYPAAGQATPKK